MRILISAYSCGPDRGSEPGVGWNWIRQIAKSHETWVLTTCEFKSDIEKFLYNQPIPNLHFYFFDTPLRKFFWRFGDMGLRVHYILWQLFAFFISYRLHRSHHFDLAHHVTFGNMWLPTFMPLLPIPFIWGPIGGGEQVPKPFRRDYPLKSKFQEFLRDIILCLLRVNPLFLYTCRQASVIIVRTSETLNRIPNYFRFKTIKMIETGVNDLEVSVTARNKNNNFLQVISVGRLIHWKGFDLAIKAFAKVCRDNNNIKMIIIGDGPEKERLQKLSEREGVANRIVFIGQLKHDKVLQYMAESSIFLYSSLKEGGAWVLFEAMLIGLPIICLDIAGPSEIISDDCGFKIAPIHPEQTINDLADALLKLASDPALCKKMGEAGRKRVLKEYNWDKKGEFIQKIYQSVLSK